MLTWVIIQVVSLGFTMGYTGLKCWQYGGVYYETPSHIEIYVCDLGDWQIEYYKAHETGHYVDSKLIKEQKEEYKKLYESHKKIGLKAFYRPYWMTSVQESFAEDYAFLNKKTKNKYIRQRVAFIKKLWN